MALAQGASWLVAFNGELYRAVGRPLAEVLLMGPLLVVYAAVYLIAVSHGLDAFLWCRVALSILGIAAHVLVARWVVQLPARQWLRPLATLGLGFAVSLSLPGPWWADALVALVAAIMLWWGEWPLIRQVHRRWRASAPSRLSAEVEV